MHLLLPANPEASTLCTTAAASKDSSPLLILDSVAAGSTPGLELVLGASPSGPQELARGLFWETAEGEKSCQEGVPEGDLLFSETPKSFGAGEEELSGSEVSLWEEFDAISRSFPSRKDKVEAFGVAESERLRWVGRERRPMQEADSTEGGRRRLPGESFMVANRTPSVLSSRSSERRAAASICSEIVELGLWSVRVCSLLKGLGSSCKETLDCCWRMMTRSSYSLRSRESSSSNMRLSWRSRSFSSDMSVEAPWGMRMVLGDDNGDGNGDQAWSSPEFVGDADWLPGASDVFPDPY